MDMEKIDALRRIPLGIPLTLVTAGTVASLMVSKQLHVGFGVAWTVLSALHGLQHYKKLCKDADRMINPSGTEKTEILRHEKIHLKDFLKTVRIASAIPGRIRVYSELLAGNETLTEQASDYVKGFTGVQSVQANPVTGSLLIRYDRKKLRTKKGLAELEQKLLKG